ncbi:MAG: hypothetical protein KGL53_11835, partial [Elusimicrobia bacterium]|nr:hypothetical protein [Elusimicrobiota bacterium]
FKGYDDKWPFLMAYLYTAQKVGGPELLPALEAAMAREPGNLSASYEQPFFELPLTWAKVAVRTGKVAEFMRPEPGADGAPAMSKIQRMLASKDPMTTAAALYAVALAQQRLGGRNREADLAPRPDAPPPGDFPQIYDPKASGGSVSSGGSSAGGVPYHPGDWDFDVPAGPLSHHIRPVRRPPMP